jgi:outer membrane protein assembly factor BamB
MRRRRVLAVLAAGGVSGCLRLAGEETTRRGTATTRRTSAETTPAGTATSTGTTPEESTETSTETEPERSPLLADAPALELRWTGPEYASGLAPAGDDVVVEDSGLVALDAEAGFRRWEPFPDDNVRRFAVDGDLLVVGTRDGDAVGIDLASREERWRYEGTDFQTAIRVASGAVVFGEGRADGGAVVCLDRAAGSERWRVETAERVSDVSAPATGVVLFGTNGGPNLEVHDVESGARRWRHEEFHPAMAPVAADDTGYVASADEVVAYDVANGDVRWEASVPERADQFEALSPRTVPVVRDGRLYVPVHEGGVLALDATSGDRAWFYEIPDTDGGVVVPDGDAVWYADEVAVHRVDASTGEGDVVGYFERDTTDLGGFAVADDTVFVAPTPTAVRAFDVVD